MAPDLQSAAPGVVRLMERARLQVLRTTLLISLIISAGNLVGSLVSRAYLAVALATAWCLLWALAGAFVHVTDRVLKHWLVATVMLGAANAATTAVTGGIHSQDLAVCMWVGWAASVVLAGRAAIVVSVTITSSIFAGYLLGGASVSEVLAGPGRYNAVSSAVLPLLVGLVGVLLASVTKAILSHLTEVLLSLRRGAPATTPAMTALMAGRPVLELSAGSVDHAQAARTGAALTNAEREIVALLADGYRAKQIALLRGVQLSTVRSQIKTAKRKTGARTLDQLVLLI